jgi:endoglucanase
MNPAFTPAKLTAGVSTPEFREFAAFLTRMASRLEGLAASRGNRNTRLALELMNEPEITPDAWAPMLAASYRAARLGAPLLPLVVGGGSMNEADSLTAIDATIFAGDNFLLYTFHDYQPWQFTHQGVQGNPAYMFDCVPYPAPADPDAMVAATDRRIAALTGTTGAQIQARRALISYARSAFDRRAMTRIFDSVDAWRKARGLPPHAILLGEFGVHLTPYMRTPDGVASRLKWLQDMRELAEDRGFAWACWTYVAVGGFAIADREVGPGFDEGTRRALGLSSAT